MKFAVALVGLIFFILVFITLSSQNTVPVFPTVTVDIPGQGNVLGNFDQTSWTNQTFMQFRGIPFAESPKGQLRFKPPVEKLPWRQIIDATKYGRRCPVITTVSELSEKELGQDLEDCLNLSVYTKNLTNSQPVMFYLYGGGFYNGSSSDHPPKYLLEKDIVLVVPQYRVGALGWLTSLSTDMPGNAPIHDILLALQWVQKHIREFGGDPENVTIFGQSAGAALVGSLLLSPETPSGVFKRAIIQSGSILASWAINKQPLVQLVRICEALDCAECHSGNESIYTCLREVSVKKLLEVTTKESFAPVVRDLSGLLPEHPAELILKYSKSIPIMTGFTKHDGSFVLASYYDEMKKAIGNMSYVTVRKFAEGIMEMTEDTTRLTHNLYTRLLFPTNILETSDHKNALPSYFDLTSIQFMKSPVIAFTSKMVEKRIANIYLYSFDYNGENTRFGYEFGNDHYPFNGGVHHSNDNIYLFSTHHLNANDTEFAKKMVDIWTSFASFGVPQVANGPMLLPMESGSGPYFRINEQVTIDNDILLELTSTIDDPDNKKLDREEIEF